MEVHLRNLREDARNYYQQQADSAPNDPERRYWLAKREHMDVLLSQ